MQAGYAFDDLDLSVAIDTNRKEENLCCKSCCSTEPGCHTCFSTF